MRQRLTVHRLLIASLLVVTSLFVASAPGIAQKIPWPNVGEDPIVTPVSGPGWLTHLGLALKETTLGQAAPRYGPPPGTPGAPAGESLLVSGTVPMSGADLYRLNCQACHRAEGTGTPPEIHSLLGAVQGTSLSLVRTRLRQQSGPDAERLARTEARRARADMLTRLHKGGTRMPPRDYLKDDDVQQLFGYLLQLAGDPGRQRQSTRTISWARRGELVVKGTCHICHDAVGALPSDSARIRGAIPSLESVMKTKSLREFVHKARNGEVVSLSDPSLKHRGRMPVFYFLRDEEVASAYVYLATYPPKSVAQ